MRDNAVSSPDWRIRNVRWVYVFSKQDYANIFCSVLLVIALALMHWVATPRHPVFYLYDATISYPFIGNPTVPSWVPVLIPFIMLIGTVIIGELVYSRRQHHTLTDCLATMIYFLLDGVQAFVFTIFMTVLTKLVCGRLRPDFLARCNPNLSNVSNTVQLAFGQDITSLYPCQSSGGNLEDGYKSFPSGHASTGFSLTVYASAYLIWCFNMRKPWNPEMRNWPFKRKFLSDFGNILAKYWMLAMLMFSWGVALSRTIDYQHNYSDIMGGAFLGTLVAVVYALRAIPRYRRVLSPEALEDAKAAEELECVHAEHVLLDGGHNSVRRTRSGRALREVVVSPSSVEA